MRRVEKSSARKTFKRRLRAHFVGEDRQARFVAAARRTPFNDRKSPPLDFVDSGSTRAVDYGVT